MGRLEALSARLEEIDTRCDQLDEQTEPLTDEQLAEYKELTDEKSQLVTQHGQIQAREAVQVAEWKERRARGESDTYVPPTHRDEPGHGAGNLTGRRYGDLFGPEAARDSGGFKSEEDFLKTVHADLAHPGLRLASMSEGVGSEGGFLVPPEHAAAWLDGSLEDEIVRPRADVTPMLTSEKKIGTFDNSSNSAGSPFGILPRWVAENEEITEDQGVLRAILLKAKKCACLIPSSNELLADGGMTLEKMLGEAIKRSIGWGLDVAFISGTGADEPLGILSASSSITVDKEAGQAAATIQYPNITKMFARLHPACVPNAIWIASSTTIPQLLALSHEVGTGGSIVPVISESNGEFRMLTKPVIFTEKTAALGDVGDLILVDLTQYVVGLRRDISLDKSRHLGFHKDQAHYRCIVRADGQPKWASAYTPLTGDTQSWCVTLAERS